MYGKTTIITMQLKETFDDFIEYLHEKGRTEKTIKQHKRFLHGALSHAKRVHLKEIEDLKLADVSKIIEAGRRHGKYGAQKAATTFRMLMKYLHLRGEDLPFDWRDINVPSVPNKEQPHFGQEEAMAFLNALPTSTMKEIRTKALCEVLYSTGLRISEALDLNKEDINWGKQEAVVVNGKTDQKQPVYFTDRSLKWLKEYLDRREDSSQALFTSRDGHRLKQVTSRAALKDIRENVLKEIDLNIPVSHHDFRRALGTTIMSEEGKDPKIGQKIMRHASLRNTLKYYNLVNRKKAKDTHSEVMNEIHKC